MDDDLKMWTANCVLVPPILWIVGTKNDKRKRKTEK